ncbi:UDP-N-acetylmuramoyl-L-alanine--D-glutamate ligase [Paenibacillus selenitireducens]|uniref:UDP-N-acetylmuramoylalanine--D-glutamate ligase n=1 Tax=Paenibacillus selenitireducens TaxID=1324314 RepID=A0A1T2XEZ7_9BACL|nr:UDP-N-acetylmuramoyl-L-alanine--D-glutamate ligase [Paenibacillus selenitireducens]OPA78464.1 UDP-N-acetylmuramoyl-L-alanine--D-glutamate ligase [Paenibacillus selenitireducens]
MKLPEAYRGQDVVVLGLAKSGLQVAKVLSQWGANVTVNDKKERNLSPEADELEALGISVICGGHPDELIHPGVALVVKNPGIPYSVKPLQQALQLGIEIVTEVEVASYISDAPIIGITGSNGKTTTTTWVGEILDRAGLHPIVAGNIGTPLVQAVADATSENRMVVELSSFQLKGTRAFHPHIACLLNIVETHLDYHGTMDDYVASKVNIFANQTADDFAILNMDDAVCRSLVAQMKAKVLPFSGKEQLEYGVYVEPPYPKEADTVDTYEGIRHVVYRDAEGQIHEIIEVGHIGIPARYNVDNALAASAISIAAGVEPSHLRTPLSNFRGVEHRLEFVESKNGVVYYNNSKATNSIATIKALQAFKDDIVLIAGGLDRGSDYLELLPALQHNVKAVVVMGQTKEKIAGVAQSAGIEVIKTVDTVEDAAATLRSAVIQAAQLAQPGDVVLLSPACASWDMFESYEQRGRIFKEAVHNL